MSWQPILLFAVAGFLVGGVAASWRSSRILAVVLAVVAAAAVAGGVLWLVDGE